MPQMLWINMCARSLIKMMLLIIKCIQKSRKSVCLYLCCITEAVALNESEYIINFDTLSLVTYHRQFCKTARLWLVESSVMVLLFFLLVEKGRVLCVDLRHETMESKLQLNNLLFPFWLHHNTLKSVYSSQKNLEKKRSLCCCTFDKYTLLSALSVSWKRKQIPFSRPSVSEYQYSVCM